MRVVRILSDFSNMCGDEGRAMRWKNKKQKLQYIEKICEDNDQAIKQKLPVLLELSQDKNPEVRGPPGSSGFDWRWKKPEINRESCHYVEWAMAPDSDVCRAVVV